MYRKDLDPAGSEIKWAPLYPETYLVQDYESGSEIIYIRLVNQCGGSGSASILIFLPFVDLTSRYGTYVRKTYDVYFLV
jgi:hypothetical protein